MPPGLFKSLDESQYVAGPPLGPTRLGVWE